MSKQQILDAEYGAVYRGLTKLSQVVQRYEASLPLKLDAMESAFLGAHDFYKPHEIERIRYFRAAYIYKFHLVALHLEELWSLTHLGNNPLSLSLLLHNVYDKHNTNDDHLLLSSMAFEGFVLQGKAFLDFYMLYLCAIFKIDNTSHLSKKRFLEALDRVEMAELAKMANIAKKYFETNVFADANIGKLPSENWGVLLKMFRDGLVHRDNSAPDFQRNQPLVNQILGFIIEEQELPDFSRFAQDVQNVMFTMITRLAADVYGLEWIPGPYREGMWRSFPPN